jgi:hypothetical protein
MIRMVDQIIGGYPFQSYGQVIENLALDGRPAKANTLFSGIRTEGVVRGVRVRDVSVMHVSDRGLQTATANNGIAFSWEVQNLQALACGSDGFRIAGMTDTTFLNCRALGCGRHGWYIDGCANSTWTNCRSEWSGQQGWNLDGGWGGNTGSGGAQFLNCSTDRNNFNGWLIKATGNAPLAFTNLMCRRDGRNGGAGGSGYAAVRVEGATMPITIDNLTVYPGVDDDGNGTNSPNYGFRALNSTWVSVNSGYLHAAVTPHQDGGGNGKYSVASVVGRATGPTLTPTRLP